MNPVLTISSPPGYWDDTEDIAQVCSQIPPVEPEDVTSEEEAFFADESSSDEAEEELSEDNAPGQDPPQELRRGGVHSKNAIRQRKHPSPREYPNLDLSNLEDPRLFVYRHHPPIPEETFSSLSECTKSYNKWAKDHGISLSKKRWRRNIVGHRIKCEIRCNRSGEPGVARQRLNAGGSRTNCEYAFYIVAVDYSDPINSPWRILHMKGKSGYKSVSHNHPPYSNIYVVSKYRRETRTKEIRDRIRSIFPQSTGAKEALVSLRSEFPGIQLTRQDLRNEYRSWQYEELGCRTKVEALVDQLEEKQYWYW